MSDAEIRKSRIAAFKLFDSLKKGEGVDISQTKTYALDRDIMIDICTVYIDIQRLAGHDTHEMNDTYTIIKRF